MIRLTPTESKVAALLVEGSANKDIAETLACSVRTVEFHVSNLLRKSAQPSRARLVALLNASEAAGGRLDVCDTADGTPRKSAVWLHR